MGRIKSSVGEDDADTDKEEVKGVRQKQEAEDEAETPTGSPALSTAVIPRAAPPRKEKRKEVREKKQRLSLKGSRNSIPKMFPQETSTAWEKKPPTKERRRSHPPRFSRQLSSLSEEPPQKSEEDMEPPKAELEDLVPRPSLQEQLTDQNTGTPVNLSASSLHQPQEIPAVETVETELKGLEDEVPSTSGDAESLKAQSSHASVESKIEDLPRTPGRRTAKVHGVHSKLLLSRDSVSSVAGSLPCVWTMGQRISRWKLAHQRGYHIDQLTQDKLQKSTIMKHERETKAAVPLPLLEVIEEEAVEILKGTLKAYQRNLGANHHLTVQLEEQAEKLHLRLKGRGVID